MARLVLFDIDGTLIRTGGAGVRAFERVFATEFQRPRGAEGLKFAGRTDPGIVRDFFRFHGIEENEVNFGRFFDPYVFWLDEILKGCGGVVLPGVTELIAGLKAHVKRPVVGLLTGNIRLGAEIKLRHYDLWDHFEMGAFGDDHENRNLLAGVARERGGEVLGRPLGGDEVIVIGDTPLDIECARAIGAPCVAVATGGATREELAAHDPEWLVDTLAELDARQLLG